MVFAAVRTHFARKNTSTFMLIGSLSRKKELSIINLRGLQQQQQQQQQQ